MADRFDFFPISFEAGTRRFEDGSEYIELRFAEPDGRTACLLFLPEALGAALDQLVALRSAVGGQAH